MAQKCTRIAEDGQRDPLLPDLGRKPIIVTARSGEARPEDAGDEQQHGRQSRQRVDRTRRPHLQPREAHNAGGGMRRGHKTLREERLPVLACGRAPLGGSKPRHALEEALLGPFGWHLQRCGGVEEARHALNVVQ